MKIRDGFVSNSSSSSFVIISVGGDAIIEDGPSERLEACGGTQVQIDWLIEKLNEAKNKGVKLVDITHGGGYEG